VSQHATPPTQQLRRECPASHRDRGPRKWTSGAYEPQDRAVQSLGQARATSLQETVHPEVSSRDGPDTPIPGHAHAVWRSRTAPRPQPERRGDSQPCSRELLPRGWWSSARSPRRLIPPEWTVDAATSTTSICRAPREADESWATTSITRKLDPGRRPGSEEEPIAQNRRRSPRTRDSHPRVAGDRPRGQLSRTGASPVVLGGVTATPRRTRLTSAGPVPTGPPTTRKSPWNSRLVQRIDAGEEQHFSDPSR